MFCGFVRLVYSNVPQDTRSINILIRSGGYEDDVDMGYEL